MIAIRARRNLGYQLVVNFQPDVLLVTQHQDLLIDLDKVMSETRTKAQRAKHSFISTASGTRAPRAALSLNASEASVTFRGRTQTVCRQGSHGLQKITGGNPPAHSPSEEPYREIFQDKRGPGPRKYQWYLQTPLLPCPASLGGSRSFCHPYS